MCLKSIPIRILLAIIAGAIIPALVIPFVAAGTAIIFPFYHFYYFTCVYRLERSYSFSFLKH